MEPRWHGGQATAQQGHGRRQESVEGGVLREGGQFIEAVGSKGEDPIFLLFLF